MGAMASPITNLTIVYSSVYSGTDQRKHQSSASLAFVRGIHRWPVNSPHKSPFTRKMFPFDDVIILLHWDGSQGPSNVFLGQCVPWHQHDTELADTDIHGPWMKNQAPAVLNDDEGDLFMRLAMQMRLENTQIARFMRPTWGLSGATGPRWVPCWPREPCYQGIDCSYVLNTFLYALLMNNDRMSGFAMKTIVAINQLITYTMLIPFFLLNFFCAIGSFMCHRVGYVP